MRYDKITPLSFKALGILNLDQPYCRKELCDALHSKTLSYLGEFKRSGRSAVEAQLALGGLIEKPKATWKEAAVEVYLALYSLHIDFDLFVSGAIDHGR